MFGISFNELLIVLALALIVLGPEKLPEIARSLGKGLHELKRATDDVTKSIMADTGLKETAESLKKTVMADAGLRETVESLKQGLNQSGLSREQLHKMFTEIEQGKSRPAQPPEAAAASAAEEPAEPTAPKKPAARFADDDAE
jgi:Tat protein translocase TatB subunit